MTDSKNYQGPVNMDIATVGRASSFTPATQIISTYTHKPKIQVRWHDSSRNGEQSKTTAGNTTGPRETQA